MCCFIESFGQNYPEQSDGTLDSGSMAVTCTFNRHGTLLAVGCTDGRIVVWDFLTRGIAKVYNAHAHPVCSLRFVQILALNEICTACITLGWIHIYNLSYSEVHRIYLVRICLIKLQVCKLCE